MRPLTSVQFIIKESRGNLVITHTLDTADPSELETIDGSSLDAVHLCPLKYFSVCNIIILFDVHNGPNFFLMKVFQFLDVRMIQGPGFTAIG